MQTRRAWLVALAAMASFVVPALAEPPASGGESVTPAFKHDLPNSPGKSLVSVLVDYAPGGKSAPHSHAKSAFIYAFVVSGQIRSQVDDAPAKVYRAGESFFELPGAHHRVSENASETEPAQLLAVFVVDSDETALTIYEK